MGAGIANTYVIKHSATFYTNHIASLTYFDTVKNFRRIIGTVQINLFISVIRIEIIQRGEFIFFPHFNA